MTLDPKLVDKRIVQRMLAKGVIDTAAYERWIAELPDLTEKLVRLGDQARDESGGQPR